jgi:hypothetical protein
LGNLVYAIHLDLYSDKTEEEILMAEKNDTFGSSGIQINVGPSNRAEKQLWEGKR